MDEMAKLLSLKRVVENSTKQTIKQDGLVELELEFSPASFEIAMIAVANGLTEGLYSFVHNGRSHNKSLCKWDDVPNAIKALNLRSIYIEFNLKQLRQQRIHVYQDERELVELCPMAPENFILIKLSLNSDKCTICPTDYNKNEILRYFQLKEFWGLLTSFSDDAKDSEITFLYKQKIVIKLNYSFDDLSTEFDGISRLMEINKEDSHADARRNIMQNTLYSFLWKEDKEDCLRVLLKRFTLFVKTFEENYRAFTVGFSFDSVRKEYVEKFRDYLSKMNGMIYESLTRALAIPITGLIGFVTMNGDDSYKSILPNLAALMLVVFSTIGTHYLVIFQMKMVSVTRTEFDDLFNDIKFELTDVNINDLEIKCLQLHQQANNVSNLLLSIYVVALTNLLINSIMFVMSSF